MPQHINQQARTASGVGPTRSGSTRRGWASQRRRPRVAGQSRRAAATVPDERWPKSAAAAKQRPRGRGRLTALIRRDAVLPAHVEPAEAEPVAASSERHPGRSARNRLVALGVVLGIAAGLAGWFGYQTFTIRTDPVAQNVALVDAGTSAQVISQVSTALERVYTFDYTRLDENQRVARDNITPEFADKFATLFDQVRKLAPQQQAVVTATVAMAAVKELAGDRAVVVVFLDQQATRGADAKQLLAAGRLTVSAQRVDGRWKIANVDSR